MTDRFFRLWALIKKEFLTILRDPKSRIIIIAPPLIQLALFANILTMETKNADIAVIDASNTLESREFVAGIENSRWFGRVIRSDNLRQARENLKNEKIHGILGHPAGLCPPTEKRTKRRRPADFGRPDADDGHRFKRLCHADCRRVFAKVRRPTASPALRL